MRPGDLRFGPPRHPGAFGSLADELGARADAIYRGNTAGLAGREVLERELGCPLDRLPRAELVGLVYKARRVARADS